MTLDPIVMIDGVLAWQVKARSDGLLLTNLFPDPQKMDDWMRRKAAFAVDGFDGCRLLVVKEETFDRIYYVSSELDAAAKACGIYQKQANRTCVLDVVGPQPVQSNASDAWGAEGFAVLKTLTRMQRRKGVEPYECSMPAIPRPTTENDAIHIYAALHKFFDARAEQLPCMEEVRDLCTNGSSFVACVGNIVYSFLLGEIQGRKGTIRYWFTAPEGRGKGLGGNLMHTFLDHCLEVGSSYQELWVIDDNENAIKRYEHYGFAFDRVKDTVFIKGE